MIFVMDVGNTNIVLGVYEEDQLIAHWRLSTNRQATADEYGMTIQNLFSYHQIDAGAIDAVILSSVVPPLIDSLERMTRQYFNIEPLVVGPGIRTGINILYDNPKEVGADRIVNAVAAFEKYGGPLIVVDFGTATTFCAIILSKNSRCGECIFRDNRVCGHIAAPHIFNQSHSDRFLYLIGTQSHNHCSSPKLHLERLTSFYMVSVSMSRICPS